jgi:hypothetical protein
MDAEEVFAWMDYHRELVMRTWHTSHVMQSEWPERIEQTVRWLVREHPELATGRKWVREWLIHVLHGRERSPR